MSVPPLAKGIAAYLIIGVLLSIMGGPQATGVNNVVMQKFIDNTTGTLSTNFTSNLPNVNEESGTDSGLLAFIDSVKAVRNFIIFVSSVGLAIPMVLLDMNIPPLFQLLIGLPTTILLLLALAYFVRSGS